MREIKGKIYKVRPQDIPLGKVDQRNFNIGRIRHQLKNSIIENGIKYPIEVVSLTEVPYGGNNVLRGCGRIYWAIQLGIEYVDVIISDFETTRTEGAFGNPDEWYL